MRKFSQMAAAAMGMAKGTSADRPENPAVGDQFVNGTLGITEVYTENDGWQPLTSSSTGIPFGGTADRPDNDLGQPFFNGEEARLELFTTGTGWSNIVQETPGVVSVVGRYIEGNLSTTLTINGSNFASGAIASVVGQDGTETIADTTQLVSVAEVAATFSGLSATNEPYDVKVLNPSNLYGVAFDILQVDDIPVFITQSGSLGTYIEESPMSVQISATDEENQSLTFSISEGSLPAGLSLNAATGEISGTPTDVIPNTTSTFEISATDGNNIVTRNFSITVNDRGPTWQTAQTISDYGNGKSYSYTLIATDDNGTISSYSVVSGALPNGLSLNSSTGEISGTPLVSDVDYIFTVRATDQGGNSADRQFTLPNQHPTVLSSSSLSFSNIQSISIQIDATDDGSISSYSLVSGSLPSGISLNSTTGILSGQSSEPTGHVSNFEIEVIDNANNSTFKSFAATTTDSKFLSTNSLTFTMKLEEQERHPTNTSISSISWTESESSNSIKFHQSSLDTSPSTLAFSHVESANSQSYDYGRLYEITPLTSGSCFVALQAGGGGGFVDGYGGTGGGGGAFALVKLNLDTIEKFYVRVPHQGVASQGTWNTGYSGNGDVYPAVWGYSAVLYDKDMNIIARAEGGEGGYKLPNGDATVPGGAGGDAQVFANASVLESYLNSGGDGGSSSGQNGREVSTPGTAPSFDKDAPSLNILNGTNGFYNQVGDSSNGTWMYGSRSYNTWQGQPNNQGFGGQNNSSSYPESGTLGDWGGGSAGKDSIGSSAYGSAGSRGYVAIYESIS